jgi:ER-bound oxygenase mpaB/B'/Rubber oxygenase, catalytic domain
LAVHPVVVGLIDKTAFLCSMEFFVSKQSIVREVWGKSDTILFVFAGASAEFALNKAVDWLYFTGRLPADPLGRLFSTVMYARLIVFSEMDAANKAIDKITAIHSAVEKNRGATIPDWAYRDVLFMLIHYSIASFEVLERKLTEAEKEDLFDVFYRMGLRMQLRDLPQTYQQWLITRREHMEHDLQKSHYTTDLYLQYRKHLGRMRFFILKESQKLVVPQLVKDLLGLGKYSWVSPLLSFYKFSRRIKLDGFLKSIILPAAYKKEISELDVKPS